MIYLLIMVVICFLLWVINFLVTVKVTTSLNQIKSFECGFEFHHYQTYMPSIHFFKLALIFILFDLELLFLLTLFNNLNWLISLLLILFLIVTLVLEFNLSSLNWNL